MHNPKAIIAQLGAMWKSPADITLAQPACSYKNRDRQYNDPRLTSVSPMVREGVPDPAVPLRHRNKPSAAQHRAGPGHRFAKALGRASFLHLVRRPYTRPRFPSKTKVYPVPVLRWGNIGAEKDALGIPQEESPRCGGLTPHFSDARRNIPMEVETPTQERTHPGEILSEAPRANTSGKRVVLVRS